MIPSQIKVEKFSHLIDMPLRELMFKADSIREKFCGNSLEICSITNAKSGKCPQDCKYCAQSSYNKADIEVYPLKVIDDLVKDAKKAKKDGAKKFSIVTSGRKVSETELKTINEAVKKIIDITGLEVCASLGILLQSELEQLKKSGVTRYHHNIETSREYFPSIVSTHTFENKLETIKNAKAAGLEVCSGVILGMGESFEDRISMAISLKELDVEGVPINILTPIKGTPLENSSSLSVSEILRSIAIFRVILQDKIIKVVAGRDSVLKDAQILAFTSGANSFMVGDYLTTQGRSCEDDKDMANKIINIWES